MILSDRKNNTVEKKVISKESSVKQSLAILGFSCADIVIK